MPPVIYPTIKSYDDVKESLKGRKEFVMQVDQGLRFIKYKSIVENTFMDQSEMKGM